MRICSHSSLIDSSGGCDPDVCFVGVPRAVLVRVPVDAKLLVMLEEVDDEQSGCIHKDVKVVDSKELRWLREELIS